MHSDFHSGKFIFVSRQSTDYTSWNLVSSLGLFSPDLGLKRENKFIKLSVPCPLSWQFPETFDFQNLSWQHLSALTCCKLGFTEQKFSIHEDLWKISKGRNLSLLTLVSRFCQINANYLVQLPTSQPTLITLGFLINVPPPLIFFRNLLNLPSTPPPSPPLSGPPLSSIDKWGNQLKTAKQKIWNYMILGL